MTRERNVMKDRARKKEVSKQIMPLAIEIR